jgi:hypothetical protein
LDDALVLFAGWEPQMAKVTILVNLTLDGVMQGTARSEFNAAIWR